MRNNMSENVIIKNLEDAGCDEKCIKQFMECYRYGDKKEVLKTLAEHRESILDKLHAVQKEIDCLDYLVYQIGKQEG